MKDIADKFVLVRVTRIDTQDLNLFEFDYDLTLIFFFLDADGKVYARYGGRGPEGPDARQSLEGLRYTMESVLAMHRQEDKSFAPRIEGKPRFIREVSSKTRGCVHCHQVREMLDAAAKRKGAWERDDAYRYPLPENLGMFMEVHKGNVVKKVADNTPAAAIGVKPGDRLVSLNAVPTHSFSDIQFSLDRAPKTGAIEVVYQRGDMTHREKLTLKEGWKRTDLSWRPSMQRLIPSVRLSGDDLGEEERKKLGLSPKQLAFRQKDSVPTAAKEAGIQPGDVILDIDAKGLQMDMLAFNRYVREHYLIGDRVTITLLRDGKREERSMKLGR